MNLTLSTAALAGLEKLINSALRYDPGTRIALAKLSHQILAITISSPALTIYFTPDEEGVRLMSQWEGEIHTHLYGSLPALIKLARSDRTSFSDSGVEVIGNTGLLVDLQRLLKNLDIDWEDALSEFLGDIVGHQSAEVIRGGAKYTRDRARDLRRSTSEFLTEELQSVVSKNELEDFYQDVDDLRLQLDRLEARARLAMKDTFDKK